MFNNRYDAIDQTLAALAEPTRRRVVELLHVKPQCAGDLAHQFGMSAAAMSRHLRLLRQTGLVEQSSDAKDTRLRIYYLRKEQLAAVREWFEEVAAQWTAQLGAFKAHAERTRPKKPKVRR
jgi:DNA-binding transcriptional ArsR family regulator